ncbi:MAG: DNA polymerase [Leptospiraceae bacterium]|nr:DNA polymerase [Leptospiraceae bacterium]
MDSASGSPFRIEGWLFDIYHMEDQIYLCLLDASGRFYLCRDEFRPVIYARGPENTLKRLVHRLHEMEGIHGEPFYVKKKLFYQNRVVDVLSISIARPSLLRRIKNRLYALYGRMDLFHTDFEIPAGYMQQKGIFPLCRLRAKLQRLSSGHHGRTLFNLLSCEALDDIFDLDFAMPQLKIARLRLNYGHRLTLQKALNTGIQKFDTAEQRIIIECEGQRLSIPVNLGPDHLQQFNDFLLSIDPDVILSAYGDQVIMPVLFQAFQKHKMIPHLDRDVDPGALRKIVVQGTSYNTYGNWIYRAPSYPLFGRWHIDSANSFVFKESQLMGIVELSRMSRIPVQRMSRSSTGAALTSIECEVALQKDYLVPWQKSGLEEPRTVMHLLEADKGGLVFVPNSKTIMENVAQIDFAQMYPSIMNIHNVSPETINCLCCKDSETDHVPEIGFRICVRRRGIVSDALAHILKRRKHYKTKIKALNSAIRLKQQMQPSNDPNFSSGSSDSGEPSELERLEAELEDYDQRQSSLKWMLVTSFGYLGYRNAKFGKIESHEAVTAFGRDKLLIAKEMAEEAGFSVVHGITDCLFLSVPQMENAEAVLLSVCERIGEATGIEMSLEGIYDWVVFLPSRTKPGVAVVNRYFGRFKDGNLRVRGISVRRKDRPVWIKEAQNIFLESMANCSSAAELAMLHDSMEKQYRALGKDLIDRRIPWTDLLLRRTVSKGLEDYSVDGPAPAALRELQPYGIEVQAGEKVKYLVLEKTAPGASRYMSEEILFQKWGATPEIQPPYDVQYYSKLLYDAFEEVWQYAAPAGYFQRKDLKQLELEI